MTIYDNEIDKNENIIGTFNYDRYKFNFDSVYQDRNMFFIFDCSQNEFIDTDQCFLTFT